MKAWIARDANGEVYLFREKPKKGQISGQWTTGHLDDIICMIIPHKFIKGCNPKWSDEEPIEVELTKKKV